MVGIWSDRFPCCQTDPCERSMSNKIQLRRQIKTVLTNIALELLDGKFASIKFDETEKKELAATIRRQLDELKRDPDNPTLRMLLSLAEQGFDYVSAEAPALSRVPVGWVTQRDHQYFAQNNSVG